MSPSGSMVRRLRGNPSELVTYASKILKVI